MTRLDELTIRSLGVIDDARVPVGAGFTAITGETGAGKTMVVQALALLRGERADAGVIRAGSDRAAVQGVWLVDDAEATALVEDAGGTVDDGELILGRGISRGPEGSVRSRAQAGGAAVPAGLLRDLADRLVAVHGQSDQQRLRSAEAQAAALDRAAGEPLERLLAEYRMEHTAWTDARDAAERIRTQHDARAAEAASIRAELEELEAFDPQPGEQDELAAIAGRLEHSESLRAELAEAHAALSGDDAADAVTRSAIVQAGTARRLVERASTDDAALTEALDLLVQADALLQEASASIVKALEDLERPERSLDEVQQRRADLSGLERRLGRPLEVALEEAPANALRLAELDGDDEQLALLAAEEQRRLEAATALADRLSALRQDAARRLEAAVGDELAALAMPNARLVVEVAQVEALGPLGRDRVTMLLAPHPGAEPRPIQKGASGGELSRIMLALEVALADESVPTMVFDEVDAGVGGAAAIEIGRRLARLAEHCQVIVVTHLAQVAAFAEHHVRVEKGTDGRITASQVTRVDGEERLAELARMLSGTASETALAHARELLEDARVVG
ncbi:DNA repair protein RecN [Agrococcus carbonis]|uniref:DNA repair protein RecN n=1 Tax=Agrococcus carbonis TaxID=684552 RepID=A0A1H1SP36_9MICO|nr:DNA repair protein RecN [Agrococcus carbonis]SDS49608.1 DNA replication and repair protein RecN [Agrococcus carbonis]